jgi:hypothetical protein
VTRISAAAASPKLLPAVFAALFAVSGAASAQTQAAPPVTQEEIRTALRQGNSWVLGRMGEHEEWFVYMDATHVVVTMLMDRVRGGPTGVDVWLNWYYRDARPARTGDYRYDHMLEHDLVDCAARRWATLRGALYLDGTVVDEYQPASGPPPLTEPLPDTVGEEVVENVCIAVGARQPARGR